jgi:hypothetical protein
VIVTCVLCCLLGLEPVMVTVRVPLVWPARTVKVVVPDPVTDVGLNVPVVPPGNPVALKVTFSLKPAVIVTVTVKVVVRFLWTDRDEGDAEMEKSPATGALTTSVTELVCTRLPLVPVTVNG